MSDRDHTAEEYRQHLHAHSDDLLDQVASHYEWSQFKQGVALWLADNDAEWDQIARDEEQGIEP